MNKKFLSAVLFGALMVSSTGTFVSCKDYDDDIDNLQEQIDKLATKEDMTSQIAALQSALDAAKTEAAAAKASAEEAVKKATSAESTATDAEKAAAQAALDAANAKTEAIKAAQDEVAKVKAELEAAIDAKFESSKKELAETIAELTKKVEELTGYTTGMLTSIHLLEENAYDSNLDLNFYRIAQVVYPKDLKKGGEVQKVDSYEFGKGLTGAFTIKKGDVNTVTDHMLVNVAPVNAALSAESLSLINGEGSSVSKYVNITASNYTENIIKKTRSAASTGLREIGVQLKNDVDFEAFDKLVIKGTDHAIDVDDCNGKHAYIAYALSVTDGKSRTVTSDFDITMHVQKEKMAVEIEKETYIFSDASIFGKAIDDYAKGEDKTGDDEGCFPVESGSPFYISVASNLRKGGRVMASYVVVDYDNATLTTADKAALKGISFSGVDAVSRNLNHSVTMSGQYAAGIPVPLKLVTIDYTGNIEVNIVWVKVGEPVLMDAAFTVTPTTNVKDASKWVAVSTFEAFKVPANTAQYTIFLEVGESNHQKPVQFIKKENFEKINNSAILNLYESDKKTQTTNIGKVAYAKFVGELNLQIMREDKEYAGVIKFYNAEGTYLGSNALSVKKVLPTVIPAGLTAKTGVIHSDGTMPIYPKPMTNSTKGEFELSQAFIISNQLASDLNLVFNTPSFLYSDSDTKNDIANYASRGRKIENILSSQIGKDTKYPTTVTYDYGDIKYHPEGHGVEEPGNCIIEWTTKFDIVLGCYVADSKFAWYAEPEVIYSQDKLVAAYDAANKKYVDYMTAKNPYSVKINPFDAASTNTDWMTWAVALNKVNFNNKYYTIELWSNGDKDRKDEFFTATVVEVDKDGKETTTAPVATALKLTKNPSSTAKPENDVPTTVVFKFKDKFGHDETIKALTFTMKKDANK